MADHKIISRLWNLWNGFVSLWVEDIEKEHPEIAYQNAIQSMTGKLQKLRLAAGRVVDRRNELEKDLKEKRASALKTETDLQAAVATQEDDLALILIEKKNALAGAIAELEGQLEQAKNDASTIKGDLTDLQTQINKLKAEQTTMLAQFHSAKTRMEIQDSLDGLSVDAELKSLDSVRSHIRATIGAADVQQELREADVDVRLNKLSQRSGSVNARAELARMKQAAGVAAGSTAGGSGKSLG